ncbi:cyclic nucleotide-binding domain-containing protein [Marinobacterium aestuariivivens]|uniref:Cyclic nucleotide-binding domain-containing protein n=1 Tax=Marinobacterium aestuariivivens TaxID=1698799 RepID=A0ABW2A2T0_9GAMM
MIELDRARWSDFLKPDSLSELSTFGALSRNCVHFMLNRGRLLRLEPGEVLYRPGTSSGSFFVLLDGALRFYKHFPRCDVFTRVFRSGEQLGFDAMIGLHERTGTPVAMEPLLILEISVELFHDIHLHYPADFGLIMINLARELSREIAALEEVIGQSSGWMPG